MHYVMYMYKVEMKLSPTARLAVRPVVQISISISLPYISSNYSIVLHH